MTAAIRLLLALLAACAPTVGETTELGNTRSPRRPDGVGARALTTMTLREGDLHQIDALLRAGKLREAAVHGYLLARPHPHVLMTKWPEEAARLRDAARALVMAETLPQAMRADARIAGACGACHARAGATAAFERVTQAPRDDGTLASHLRRHRWAADRVWDGVVGASEMQWRAGLEVFANDLAGYRIHQIATRALGQDRETVYAELLDACLTCHPSVQRR